CGCPDETLRGVLSDPSSLLLPYLTAFSDYRATHGVTPTIPLYVRQYDSDVARPLEDRERSTSGVRLEALQGRTLIGERFDDSEFVDFPLRDLELLVVDEVVSGRVQNLLHLTSGRVGHEPEEDSGFPGGLAANLVDYTAHLPR